ncbi:hypothetical protein ACR6HW_04060 [Fusibacter sp. JL298sf-3]
MYSRHWFERVVVTVCQGKGRKDRIVALSETLSKQLKVCMSRYQPYDYLFNNQENTRSIVDCTL